MPQNISKYVAINDFLLLEYEFSRDGSTLDLDDLGATVAETTAGYKQYFNTNKSESLGVTNNILELNSVATNSLRSDWFNNYDNTTRFFDYFESSTNIADGDDYEHDTVKLHVISGYNFDDITGFLLQIRAEDSSSNLVDLSNFTYIKQPETRTGNVINFSANTLFLGNKYYDKYIELKIPSVRALGDDTAGGYDTLLGETLNIKPLSDVHITYSTVPTVQFGPAEGDNVYTLVEEVDLQLPVTSNADRFNAFIAESTSGDYIEYYATFDNQIIGQYMADIESGRIPLYTSNNPNDNYQEFTDTYGVESAKWVLIHEIFVYEHFGNSSLLTQKFSFTQDNNFSQANRFRPVLQNADIDSSFTIKFTCRLTNRMDGSQIIRRASFSSTDPKKYGLKFSRIFVENIIPYKVFNRIEETNPTINQGNLKPRTKYIKVFYDTTEVLVNQNNELYPQGTAPLTLKNGDSVYKFKFERYNEDSDNRENVDLSGAYNYGLLFVMDDDTTIEVGPTYSTNMNTTIGELEFKLNKTQVDKLLNQENKAYSIIVKNPNGTSYNFYEGQYYSYEKRQEQQSTIQSYIQQVTTLNKTISSLRAENSDLKEDINEAQEQIDSQTLSLQKQESLVSSDSNNYKKLQDDYQLLQTNYKNLQKKYNTLIASDKTISEKEEELSTQLSDLQLEIDRSKRKYNALKSKAKTTSTTSQLSSKELELSKQVDELQNENEKLSRKNIELENDGSGTTVQKPQYPSKQRPTRDISKNNPGSIR